VEDGDESQAPRTARRALSNVYVRNAEHEDGHNLGVAGSGGGHAARNSRYRASLAVR
jgi:hypothetical protein